MATRRHQAEQKAQERVRAAMNSVVQHPLFHSFKHATLVMEESRFGPYPTSHRLVVNYVGYIYARPAGDVNSETWQYGIAMCLLHLLLGHSTLRGNWTLFRHAAAHIDAHRFLVSLKLVPIGEHAETFAEVPNKSVAELEEWLAINISTTKIRAWLPYPDQSFFVPPGSSMDAATKWVKPPDFTKAFAEGIRRALEFALDVAAGRRDSLTSDAPAASATAGQRARAWLLAHYPLLSGIAAYFTLIESVDECRAEQVHVGMINVLSRKVYLNPLAGLQEDEWRWVLAHEYLHAGLNHAARQDGRDPEIWNVACDFAINDWLEALRIGKRPPIGVMYDTQFHGWSAERIYDFLTRNLRILRKWETLAGPNQKDFIGAADGADTDAERYCREALCQGYFRHQSGGRGTLPAELTESIRALEQPVIPWDVQLGRWFDLHVPFPERRRSYLRPSRRQQASPDTPLPRTVITPEYKSNAHTFGVILDTSGSMSRTLLAKSLGTIAQYALAHEVPAVRVVFCDAQPYDAGYIRPDDLLYQPVEVQGRGGTELKPAVEFLESQENFPDTAPVLILTDGETDDFQLRRTHAFVLPKGRRLPFSPAGEVFYIS
jgi:predicted metal-dependent peptidase